MPDPATIPLHARVADAVASALNDSGLLPDGVAAVRRYRPRRELIELADPVVTVVPKAIALSGASRSTVTRDVQVDVALQQKLANTNTPDSDADTDAAIDPLAALAESLAEHLSRRRLDAPPAVAWRQTEADPLYVVEHLDELAVFTAVITLTYRTLA